MKLTIEMTSEEEIRTFYERMFVPANKTGAPMNAPVPDPQPAPTPEPAAAVSAEPVQTEGVAFEDVTKAAIRKMDEGKQAQLRELLQKYGVQALPDLKGRPDQLAQFYKDLEVL